MKTLPQKIRNSLSVLIQEYFKLDKNRKILFSTFSIIIALILSYTAAKVFDSLHQKPVATQSTGISPTILKENEKLISVKINNSSKYILESLNHAAILTIVGKNSLGKTFTLSEHAKLVEVASAKNQNSGEQEYIVTIILNKHEAYEILKQESKVEISLMLNSPNELVKPPTEKRNYSSNKLQIINAPNFKEDIW